MRSRIYRVLSHFFDSVWYPAVYAAICVPSGISGKAVYVPMACVLATLIILSTFFAQNRRSFIAPIIMSFYCIGIDRREGFNNSSAELLGYYDLDGFLTVIVIGVIAAAFLFVRLVRMGVFKKPHQGKGSFLWSILLLGGAMQLNGIGSSDWQPVDLLYGFIFAAVLIAFYFLFRGCLDGSGEDVGYICRMMVTMSLIALVQLLIMCVIRWQEGTFFGYDPDKQGIFPDRTIASLGWGIATSVGGVLVIGVPAAMYLAVRERRGNLWCLLALALIAVSLIPRSRSSVAAAALLFVIGLGVGCFYGNNKKQLRIIAAVLGISAAAAIITVILSARLRGTDIIAFFRIDKLFDDDRWNMWLIAWEDLKSAPLFGVGFEKGTVFGKYRPHNVFSNMYHGIIPQFYGAMGILGICAIGKHLFDLGKTVFHRFSVEKLLLAAVPGMILMMSMVDNFFFYANYQFVYCLFLALLEKSDCKRLAQ